MSRPSLVLETMIRDTARPDSDFRQISTWQAEIADQFHGLSVEDAWRSVLTSIPFDESSFKILYGRSRRTFTDNLAAWCIRCLDQPELARSERAGRSEAQAFGHVGVMLLTLATLEDAEERKYQDLANRADSRLGDDPASGPATVQTYRQVCERLLRSGSVGGAIRSLYRPPITGDVVSAAKSRTAYDSASDSDRVLWEAFAGKELTQADAFWNKVRFGELTFHEFGTTSFIVRARDPDQQTANVALKFVLLPYAELSAIAEATRFYRRDHGDKLSGVANAAGVRCSSVNWIAMDFVDGETLDTFVRRWERDKYPSGTDPTRPYARRRTLEVFAPLLFDAMENLSRSGAVHADLNPSNIIVTTQTAEGEGASPRYTVVFVDFGRNYLSGQSGFGRPASNSRYIAPEVESDSEPNPRADLYSLGQLLIGLSGVGRELDGAVPDAFYRHTPFLARFIEDLIDDDPDKRLLVMDPPRDVGLYEWLGNVFRSELNAVATADRRDGLFGPPSRSRQLALLLTPLSGVPLRQARLVRVLRRSEHPNQARLARARALLRWSLFSAFTFYLAIIVVGFLLLQDLHLIPATWLARSLQILRVPGYEVPPEHITDNLTARIVGLTFVLIATKYYQNIYGGLTTKVADRTSGAVKSLRGVTEFFIRINTFFVVLIVVPVNLINPAWWTAGTAIGLINSNLVNLFGSLFAVAAVRQARALDPASGGKGPFLSTVPRQITGLDMYNAWWRSMAAYVVIVLVFWVLIDGSVLNDTMAYAFVVSMLNLGLFYLIKCGSSAEPVRVGLTRSYLAAERLSALARRRETA